MSIIYVVCLTQTLLGFVKQKAKTGVLTFYSRTTRLYEHGPEPYSAHL
jgi:hypothetical protein